MSTPTPSLYGGSRLDLATQVPRDVPPTLRGVGRSGRRTRVGVDNRFSEVQILIEARGGSVEVVRETVCPRDATPLLTPDRRTGVLLCPNPLPSCLVSG